MRHSSHCSDYLNLLMSPDFVLSGCTCDMQGGVVLNSSQGQKLNVEG